MALHNRVQMQETFRAEGLDALVEVPLGLFPVAALLALCDTLQIWDREVGESAFPCDLDPVRTVERIERAFVAGSQVTRFNWTAASRTGSKCVGDVHVRYYLQHGERPEVVCVRLETCLSTWIKTGRGKRVSALFSLQPVVGVRISYWIPRCDKPLEVEI